MIVKLDPGFSANTQQEVNSAWVQNRHTLNHMQDHTHPSSRYNCQVSVWTCLSKDRCRGDEIFCVLLPLPITCWWFHHAKQKSYVSIETNFYASSVWLYSGRSANRIYRLMFSFDSLLLVWDAEVKAVFWAQGQKQRVCNYIQTNILKLQTRGQMDWKPYCWTFLKTYWCAWLHQGVWGTVRFEGLHASQLFAETIFFCLLFPGTKTSPCCWPQWSAVH